MNINILNSGVTWLRTSGLGGKRKPAMMAPPVVDVVESFDSLYGDADLAAYYKMDEASGDLVNSSIDAAAITNSEQIVTGATYGAAAPTNFSQAMSFDGVNDETQADNSTLTDWNFLHFTAPSVSISLWVFPTDITTIAAMIATMNGNASDDGFNAFMKLSINGDIRIRCQDGSTKYQTTSTLVLTQDAWNHVVLMINTSTNVFSIIINDGTAHTASITKLSTTNCEAKMGLAWDTQAGNFWKGRMCEVVIFNDRVLTTDEITSLYNLGNGRPIY